jgi:uncharacterized protein YgfB (UPF0149 family)
MTRSPLTHARLASALQTLRLGMGASDLHGSLTGYLCAGGSAGVEPLLPAPDEPVERRAEALVEWCRGFLGGVGLSGTPTAALSADANEVLADLGRIAASRFDYDDAEEDETALSEVLEFVRVGVLLLRTELTRPRAARRSVH